MFDPAHVDYTALTQPVSRAEVRAFRAATKAARRADPSVATALATATSVFAVAGIVGFFVVFALFAGFFVAVASNGSGESFGSAFPPLVFIALFGVVAVAVVIQRFGSRGNWTKWLRLTRFADANELRFTSSAPGPSYPGCIFTIGDARMVSDHFVTPSGRFLDFGNYRYSTGSGKNRTTRHWGFLALQLDRNMPNIVLDSKANNGIFRTTNLPATFSRDQILRLEGDFDRYFTLYCPKEYEQDALYVLTPDLMALLIDDAAPFDVEIADSWIFFYSQAPLDMLAPSTYQRLFRIVQTVGVKAIRQTARYADEKVGIPGANVVAPQGQRLRHGVSVVSIVFFIVFAAIWLFGAFHGSSN